MNNSESSIETYSGKSFEHKKVQSAEPRSRNDRLFPLNVHKIKRSLRENNIPASEVRWLRVRRVRMRPFDDY